MAAGAHLAERSSPRLQAARSTTGSHLRRRPRAGKQTGHDDKETERGMMDDAAETAWRICGL